MAATGSMHPSSDRFDMSNPWCVGTLADKSRYPGHLRVRLLRQQVATVARPHTRYEDPQSQHHKTALRSLEVILMIEVR